ncbi:MAG TPA: primase C-terminal domain-containing protein [Rubrobacteraceae bacterium]|nr:primase C-terminal domain-containing protein [Rubrobacteraceae bacterium]
MILHHSNPRERDAERFLGLLHYELGAEELIEIRHKLPGEGQPMCKKFFAHPAEAARYATTLVNDDVYAGVAPRRGEDGTKAGVKRLWEIWGDLDCRGGHSRESRLQQIKALPYHPSIVVWSGGGYHVYWLLWEPAEGPETMDQAELIMQRLAKGLDGDPVHDRSRILRVPGTKNFKYREPRSVEIEALYPDRRYELAQLQEMAESFPGESSIDGTDGLVPREVLGKLICENRRNLSLMSVAGSLRDRGLDLETILAVLIEVNRLRCMPPLDDEEVTRIAQSIGRYPPGRPRYRRSPVRRIHRKEGR